MKRTLFLITLFISCELYSQNIDNEIDQYLINIENPLKMEISDFNIDTSTFVNKNNLKSSGDIKNAVKIGAWTEYSFNSWEFYESKDSKYEDPFNTIRKVELTILKEEGLYKNGKREGQWILSETNINENNANWIKTGVAEYRNGILSNKKIYWRNGKLAYDVNYPLSKKNTEILVFFWNGKLQMKIAIKGKEIEFVDNDPFSE
ncbi:MAG: hypothetical protein AB7S50_15500 [Bacteroidales bacterium]